MDLEVNSDLKEKHTKTYYKVTCNVEEYSLRVDYDSVNGLNIISVAWLCSILYLASDMGLQ